MTASKAAKRMNSIVSTILGIIIMSFIKITKGVIHTNYTPEGNCTIDQLKRCSNKKEKNEINSQNNS